PPIMKLAGRLATAGLRMAIKGMGKLAGMASKAWNAAGRGLRALDNAISPRGVGVRALRASRAGAVFIPSWKDIKAGFQRLILRRPDRHHLFPQKFRAWFEARGIDIDRYTFEMSKADHEVIHLMGYNKAWRKYIDREAFIAQRRTPRQIMRKGVELMREFKFGGRHVPYHD
ncbi:MAG: DUF2380 domain-containing protein, partial [Planctomycetes bacterium]|nr:DUF2380 domain-containing protein [Planctomycetota bacterium]